MTTHCLPDRFMIDWTSISSAWSESLSGRWSCPKWLRSCIVGVFSWGRRTPMPTQPRKAYATDLTDEQWAILEPLVPPAKHGGRARSVDMREVINTILYLNRSGCQWDMLPHDLLPKSTVYDYFARWRDDGTWQQMVDHLRAQARTEAGRDP